MLYVTVILVSGEKVQFATATDIKCGKRKLVISHLMGSYSVDLVKVQNVHCGLGYEQL